MKCIVRLRRNLFDEMRSDLRRRHAHAFERVGFLYGRLGRAGSIAIVVPFEYTPVPDEQYVEDRTVSAMIDADALFDAHQRARSTGQCCLHVHAHGGSGGTWFSRTDVSTLDRIGPSLQRMAKSAAHGGLVLTKTTGACLMWLPEETKPVRSALSIVGFPLTLDRGGSDGC
jgi:hypothetical protein